MNSICHCISCITPPHMLRKLLESDDKDIRRAALSTLLTTARLRGERSVRAALAGAASSPSHGRRTIYDCENSTNLASARLARAENDGPVADESVNRAFDGFGATRDFYRKIFDRNSIDDRGMRLDGYVHRGSRYNNAFWDGQEMVFGDGDGIIFGDFTGSLDVIAHELTHGVTEFTAGLEYHNQPGALNESMSDVFGVLVKQWTNNETAHQADWLIGADIFTPGVTGGALRSMRDPGSAYDDPNLGKDPQPGHMNQYVNLPDTEEGDYGGVHINSGIPNKAFYLAATMIGGVAWEAAGQVWYETLRASGVKTQFQEFADTSVLKAGQLYGSSSTIAKAVAEAWREVGIRTSAIGVGDGGRPSGREEDGSASLAALAARVDALAKEVRVLSGEIGKAKSKR